MKHPLKTAARARWIPLTPTTGAALDTYLADRARRAGLAGADQLTGPLLATDPGGRMLVRRLARAAGAPVWEQISPHSLRRPRPAPPAGPTLQAASDAARRLS